MKRSHVRSHECLICAIPQMSWFARFCRKKFLLQKRQHFHGEFIFPTFSNWILPQNSAQRCLASQSTLFRSRSDLWNSFSAFLSTISFNKIEYIIVFSYKLKLIPFKGVLYIFYFHLIIHYYYWQYRRGWCNCSRGYFHIWLRVGRIWYFLQVWKLRIFCQVWRIKLLLN